MTNCGKHCSIGSPPTNVRPCMAGLPRSWNGKTRTAFSNWHTISMPQAKANEPCVMPWPRQKGARGQHSLEIAEQQYRIAERGVPSTDEKTRAIIAEGLGDIFMLRGRYEQAAKQFEAALPLTTNRLAQAEDRR